MQSDGSVRWTGLLPQLVVQPGEWGKIWSDITTQRNSKKPSRLEKGENWVTGVNPELFHGRRPVRACSAVFCLDTKLQDTQILKKERARGDTWCTLTAPYHLRLIYPSRNTSEIIHPPNHLRGRNFWGVPLLSGSALSPSCLLTPMTCCNIVLIKTQKTAFITISPLVI